MPPEICIRDVVDRCCIWESHADPAVRRISNPSPDPIYPAYVVGDSDINQSGRKRVAAVTMPKSGPDQLEDLLRLLLATRRYPGSGTGSAYSGEVATASGVGDTESSVAGCESSGVGGIGEDATVVPLWTTASEAATSVATHQTGLERSFSCGKSGHAATRCPALDDSFPFMLPGWRAEKTAGVFVMISSRVATHRRRTDNGD